MGTRRSFLRSCIAAVIAAPIVCRMAQALPVAAEKTKEMVAVLNPEWVNATFELEVVIEPGGYGTGIYNRLIHKRHRKAVDDPYPPRYELKRPIESCTPETGFENQWRQIEPFILVESDAL